MLNNYVTLGPSFLHGFDQVAAREIGTLVTCGLALYDYTSDKVEGIHVNSKPVNHHEGEGLW